jgi:putative YhbY family RNA-binding protein
MPAIQLTVAQRKEHRAEAHHLDPVVMIGGDGLTPAIKKETDAALKAHGLIKVRVFSDDRTERETMLATLADELNAAPIQHIGKLLVLWRPMPEQEKAIDEDRKPGPRRAGGLPRGRPASAPTGPLESPRGRPPSGRMSPTRPTPGRGRESPA